MATYGQYISTGYSYLKRVDGEAFVPGLYSVALDGVDLDANVVRYAGKALVGSSQPLALPAKSMRGVAITGPTNAPAIVTGAQ
jgi:hypothetical protein